MLKYQQLRHSSYKHHRHYPKAPNGIKLQPTEEETQMAIDSGLLEPFKETPPQIQKFEERLEKTLRLQRERQG